MLDDARYDDYRGPNDEEDEDDEDSDESSEDEDEDQDEDDTDATSTDDQDDSDQDEDEDQDDQDVDNQDAADDNTDEEAAAGAPVETPEITVNNAYGRRGPSPDTDKFEDFSPAGRVEDLPSNLSYENLFGPIESQGQTPCCCAFSSSSIVEALIKKHWGETLHISRRALYSLGKHKYEPQSMNEGGLWETSAIQVFQNFGHVNEPDFPFGKPTLQQLIEEVPDDIIQIEHDLSGFKKLAQMDWDTIMLTLHENGPILAGMPWHKEWEQVGKDGHMTAELAGNEVMGGHAIVLLGFSKTKNALRLRNSWGTDWGDNGYGWLPMNDAVKFDGLYTLTV